MEDSIFTRIVRGELPSHKIYEDERTFAFLDIHPIQRGHVLVVSKTQVPEFYELDEADYQALMMTVRRVTERVKQVMQPPHVGVKIEGLLIAHPHVHVIPLYDSGLSDLPEPDRSLDPDHEALAAVAEQLKISD